MNQIVTAGFDYAPYTQKFVKASKTRAKKIRDLDGAAGKNFFDIGRELKSQRDAFGSERKRHGLTGTGTWTSWVQIELGWKSRSFANRIIQVYEGVITRDGDQWSPSMTFSMMRLLVAKSTPKELVAEVVELAKQGKLPKVSDVAKKKKVMAGIARPTPKEAKAQAKATGAAILASDDRYYTPIDEKDLEAYEKRRDNTYSVIEAIEEIIKVTGINPSEWILDAEPRWLTDLKLGDIEVVGSWLEQLRKDFKVHKKIIDNEVVKNGNQESKEGNNAGA